MDERHGIFRWEVGEQQLACVSDGHAQQNVRRENYEKLETMPPYDDLPTEEKWRLEHPLSAAS